MPKMNQIIAIEKGIKTRVFGGISALHKQSQKSELFRGHARTFTPKEDDPTSPLGEQLPSENKKVQMRGEESLQQLSTLMSELFDISAMKDWGNTIANADIVVDGTTILEQVPVSYLLFLEKQLIDIHKFVSTIPTLEAGEFWNYDNAQDLWATAESRTIKTKKVPRALVLYEATQEHPAQVKETTEDMTCGTWSTTKYSGALPSKRINEILARIVKLQHAVKFAREKANEQEVTKQKGGDAIFSYLLA